MPRGVACWGLVIAVLVSVVPSAVAVTEPPTSPQADRSPIRIDGDAAFTVANGRIVSLDVIVAPTLGS